MDERYGKLRDLCADFLRPEQIILGAAAEIYSHDRSVGLSSECQLALLPDTTAEVSRIMRLCGELGVPVIPRGGGTGVTGGAVPMGGGVVLSLERMNHILEIDSENMVAVLEPGVITGDLQKAALQKGLMYPPDPASLEECTIGGNVAVRAGGPRAVKYGTTRDYLLGLECVTMNGVVHSFGGKIVKDAAGYNLAALVCGSEGTLAVITRLTMRLVPAPLYTRDVLLPYDSVEAAIDAVRDFLLARIVPSTIEFMERETIELVARHRGAGVPHADAGAHLLIQIDAPDAAALESQTNALLQCAGTAASQALVADDAAAREMLWVARRGIRDAIAAETSDFFAEDCAVPRAAIPDFVRRAREIVRAAGCRPVLFGHAGDGNVHLNILRAGLDDLEWQKAKSRLKPAIYDAALELGGTISGEHGIGYLRREQLARTSGAEHVELLRGIKRVFDPQGLLNPGKVV